jgi:hypothetical protein
MLRLAMKKIIFSLIFVFSFASNFAQANSGIALIYQGPGSCSLAEGDAGKSGYGCSEAASDVALAAGLQVKFVGPNDLSDSSTATDVANLLKMQKFGFNRVELPRRHFLRCRSDFARKS